MKRKIMLGIVFTGIFLGTTAAQSQAQGQLMPDRVTPTSWIALGTAVLVFCDIIARVFGLYKVGAGALEKKLEANSSTLERKLDDQTRHFDEQLKAVELRIEQKFNGFTNSVDTRMNGFGGRVSEVESDQAALNGRQTEFDSRMSRSEMDREHINKKLDRIEHSQDEILRHILKRNQ